MVRTRRQQIEAGKSGERTRECPICSTEVTHGRLPAHIADEHSD
jgi:hypothetical protein